MTHPNVHVVDDEPEIGRLVAIALGAQGYSVQVFESAEAFRQSCGDNQEPHLLIVDKNLPGMSGLELVDLQRRSEAVFEAIMITGFADEKSEAEASRLGICRYIRKPFALDDLRQAVITAERRLAARADSS